MPIKFKLSKTQGCKREKNTGQRTQERRYCPYWYAKFDQTNLDGNNITLVVVDISKRCGYYTLAAKNGLHLK